MLKLFKKFFCRAEISKLGKSVHAFEYSKSEDHINNGDSNDESTYEILNVEAQVEINTTMNDDEKIESKIKTEFAANKDILDEEITVEDNEKEEIITISDALAKVHFPELLEKPKDVYEVTNNDGQVVEQWYELNNEKTAANVDVLNKLEQEVKTEEDKADVKKLLAWANKKSKSKKTTTMIIREKKREEIFKRAADVDAKPIIIEDCSSGYDRHGNNPKGTD